MESITFLTQNKILSIHKIQIIRFGGIEGIRDFKLLDSAILSVQATFDQKSPFC